VTTPTPEPGERRPVADRPATERPLLERPPSERYGTPPSAAPDPPTGVDAVLVPIGLILGTAIAFVVLGAILAVTAGLVIAAAFAGWLTGRLVEPPSRAAAVGLIAVVAGLLGIWAFGRLEGGVLDPITYWLDVEGLPVVVLCLLGGGGLAAAASR
jgi:hypothetical protein